MTHPTIVKNVRVDVDTDAAHAVDTFLLVQTGLDNELIGGDEPDELLPGVGLA